MGVTDGTIVGTTDGITVGCVLGVSEPIVLTKKMTNNQNEPSID